MQTTVVFRGTAGIITITAATTMAIMASTTAIELRCIMEIATELITGLRIDRTTVAATVIRPTEAMVIEATDIAADPASRSDAVASRCIWDAKYSRPAASIHPAVLTDGVGDLPDRFAIAR